MYSKKVMKHFLHPKNIGEIKNPDGKSEIVNPVCGDKLWLFIKIGKKRVKGKEVEYIKEIKYKTLGCAAAIATSSMLSEIVKGKSIDEALKIKARDVVKKLGGLPKHKVHCSLLGINGLRKAIEDYKRKKIKDGS